MTSTQILLHGKYVVPVDETNQVLQDTCIAIQDGNILEILPTREANKKFSNAVEHYYDHHILIPGLINTHTHAAMSLFRGLANDLPLMQWLHEHIWPAEQKWVNEEFVTHGSELAIAEMLRAGVTCFNDMYFYAEETAKVVMQSGIRAVLGMIMLDFPTQYANSHDEYFEKGLALHDQYKSSSLIQCAFAPHAPYTVSNAPFERIAILSNELEVPVHIHLHETEDEISNSIEKFNMRPIQRLHKLGLISSSLVAVHMTHLEDEEIDLLASCKANVVHCPKSNMKLASGFCLTQNLLEHDINVALGTDSCASNDNLDVMSDMQVAALLAKAVSNNAVALPAAQALRCATINGAKALGIDHITGSLEAGKSADISVIDFSKINSQPMYDPVGQLVYAANSKQVSDVWIAGKQLLKNGQLITLDEQEILNNTKQWNQKIQ